MHILLVDDNRDIRDTLRTFLERKGHEVTPCPSAVDAWTSLSEGKQRYGLVLTDVRMPDMDGMELARRMRENGSNTPIIFMAGAIEEELSDSATFAPYRVLQKPFMFNLLMDAVSEAEGGQG